MICDPYFSWYAETGKIVTPFWLVLDRESGKLSGSTAEAEADLRRLSECNIQFQMMFLSP